MSQDIEQGKFVLLNFIKEMNDWELKYYKLYSEDMSKYTNMALDDLTKIYSKWITQRERKYGRLSGAPSVGTPPEYDPITESIESIENIGKNKIIINTISKQIGDYTINYRYTLKCSNDEWRIDKKERYSSYKNKWENHII